MPIGERCNIVHPIRTQEAQRLPRIPRSARQPMSKAPLLLFIQATPSLAHLCHFLGCLVEEFGVDTQVDVIRNTCRMEILEPGPNPADRDINITPRAEFGRCGQHSGDFGIDPSTALLDDHLIGDTKSPSSVD